MERNEERRKIKEEGKREYGRKREKMRQEMNGRKVKEKQMKWETHEGK